MNEIVNVYCDESCHLEHDRQKAMVLGAVSCPQDRAGQISLAIRKMKSRHAINPAFETKWTKVSPGKSQFYLDVLDYFFDEPDLHFRALVIADKARLDHSAYRQTHDEWYYKMYFDLLKVIIDPSFRYHIYLDFKDTRGGSKVRKLHEVLANANYDFRREIVERIQIVRSHEVEIIQLADLLTGIVSYANRGLSGNAGKEAEEAFWHLITKDDPRSGDRLPDFRRAARLPWCAAAIVGWSNEGVRSWDYREASGRTRAYVWLERMDYVVIMERRRAARQEVAWLVTAYCPEGDSSRRSLRRKYDQRSR